MSLYIKLSNSSVAATAVDGKWHADTSVMAPTGYFVVSGSWWYDTPSALTEVFPQEATHRDFSGGTENLPVAYEAQVAATAAGTLYVYAVCRELP